MRIRMQMMTPEEGEKTLQAWVWPEPLCFAAFTRQLQAQENPDAEQQLFTAAFPLSEEGHAAACDWVRQQYSNHVPLWQAHRQRVRK